MDPVCNNCMKGLYEWLCLCYISLNGSGSLADMAVLKNCCKFCNMIHFDCKYIYDVYIKNSKYI